MQTLTENQQLEIRQTGELRLVDPQTRQEYVAVKVELYDRMKKAACDGSDWSDNELELLAARTFTDLDNPEKIR